MKVLYFADPVGDVEQERKDIEYWYQEYRGITLDIQRFKSI